MPKPLTIPQVAALTADGVHWVSNSLYIRIRGTSKTWLFRYSKFRKAKWRSLGPFEFKSLTAARAEVLRLRAAIHEGKEPDALTGRATFAECVKAYFEDRAGELVKKGEADWKASLERYAFPKLGTMPVAAIQAVHDAEALRPIWTTKRETAGKLRARIERVLGFAWAKGLRDKDNPAKWDGKLRHLLSKMERSKLITHYKALPVAELPGLVAKLLQRPGISAKALLFCLYTAGRTGEIIGARWDEIADRTWSVPKERMKARKEHHVPLALAFQDGLADREERIEQNAKDLRIGNAATD